MRLGLSFGLGITFTLAALLIAIEPSSIFSLALSFLVIMLVSAWTGQKNALEKALLSAAVIHSMSLLLYSSQYLLMPEFMGFSGREGGIGTDDHYFYSTGVHNLDEWIWRRKEYFASTYLFSDLIRFILGFYHDSFGYNRPLQVILLNNTGLGLAPVFTASLLERIRAPENAQRLGFLLCLFSPFLLANGTILMRDGWIASMTIGCVAALLGRQWLLAALTLVVAYVMRTESALLIIGNAGILLALMLNSRPTPTGREMALYPVRLAMFAAAPFILIASLALNPELLIELGTKAVLGRPEFVEGFIRQASAAEGGTSTLLTIARQPFPIRQIGGFLFFLGVPFLAPSLIVVDGIFVPRQLLNNIESLVIIATLPLFVRAVFSSRVWRNPFWLAILLIFVADTVLLAELSMQVRHKTGTLPLYYVIVALGLTNQNTDVKRLGLAVGMGALAVNLAITYLNIL